MILKKILPLVIILGLITSLAMAEKFYIWTDKGGILNMTNHPSFAPAHLKPKEEDQSWPVTPPVIVAPPSPAPSAPIEQPKTEPAESVAAQTSALEKTIQKVEDRNEAIKKLQDLIKKLTPGGPPPPEPSQPASTQ